MQKTSKLFFRIVLLFLILSEGASTAAFAQANDSLPVKTDSSLKPVIPVKDSATADSNHQKELVVQPILRLGVGMLSYIGNVKIGSNSTHIQSPSSGRVGYDMGLAQKLSPVTEFSLNFLYGNVSVTERTPDVIWSFQSTLAGGGINLLFKILPKQEVSPYVIIGIESYEFLSRADIYDQYGNEYYPWSDGTLRSLPQTSPNAASAKTLNLNYNYSTDVTSLNLGNPGTYNQQTFAVPVGLGFMFRVGTRTDFTIGTTLHYTFTDHIDGLTPQVQGPLKGTLSNDMFVFSYVSLRFNLTRDHPKSHWYDDVTIDTTLLQDTAVHPYVAGNFDTSAAALKIQYEKYMDSTGQYGEHHVDPFYWKMAKSGTVPEAKRETAQYTQPAKPAKTIPVNITPVNPAPAPPSATLSYKSVDTNVNPTTTATTTATTTIPTPITTTAPTPIPITTTTLTATTPTYANQVTYKIQLLATSVKPTDRPSFKGITDKVSMENDNGIYKYTTGNFTNLSDAKQYLNKLKAIGYTTAFIRATKNEKNVPVNPSQSSANPAPPSTPAAEAASATAATAAAINMTGTKEGLVFNVQLGVFSATPDQDFMSMLNEFKDVSVVKDNAGLSHYLVGSYSNYQSATSAKEKIRQAGIKDACVVSFYNGHRISISEAIRLLKK